jgi:hypothetical protein
MVPHFPAWEAERLTTGVRRHYWRHAARNDENARDPLFSERLFALACENGKKSPEGLGLEPKRRVIPG